MKHIPLTQNKTALIDDEDIALICQYRWHAVRIYKTWYAGAVIDGHRTYMHRIIMDASDGIEVDHSNGNGLDNRRENLRLCTHAENLANQRLQTRDKLSRFKGVTWCRRTGVWIAQIKVAQKHIGLGRYDEEEDAARAYNRAAQEHFGEFARLNNVPDPLREPQRRTLEAYWASLRGS